MSDKSVIFVFLTISIKSSSNQQLIKFRVTLIRFGKKIDFRSNRKKNRVKLRTLIGVILRMINRTVKDSVIYVQCEKVSNSSSCACRFILHC